MALLFLVSFPSLSPIVEISTLLEKFAMCCRSMGLILIAAEPQDVPGHFNYNQACLGFSWVEWGRNVLFQGNMDPYTYSSSMSGPKFPPTRQHQAAQYSVVCNDDLVCSGETPPSGIPR